MKAKKEGIDLLSMTEQEVRNFVENQPIEIVYLTLFRVIMHYKSDAVKLLIEIKGLKEIIRNHGLSIKN